LVAFPLFGSFLNKSVHFTGGSYRVISSLKEVISSGLERQCLSPPPKLNTAGSLSPGRFSWGYFFVYWEFWLEDDRTIPQGF